MRVLEQDIAMRALGILPPDGIHQICGLGDRGWLSEAKGAIFSPIEQVWQTSTSFLVFTKDYVYKIWRHEHALIENLEDSETRRKYLQGEQAKGIGIGSDEAYLGVWPVALLARNKGEYSLVELELGKLPSNVSCDWALKMKRFPDEDRWDKMLAKHELTDEMVATAADKIIQYHNQLPVTLTANRLALALNFDQRVRQPDFDTILQTGLFNETEILNLSQQSARFLQYRSNLFDEAIRNDRVKNGHGDCKIRNIYSPQGIILDAIAFKDSWSCNDLLAELAYFLLDFDIVDSQNFTHWVEVVNQKYLEVSGDNLKLNPLFWFYLNYRAWVEAKVAGFEAKDAYKADQQIEGDSRLAEAKKYLSKAKEYLKIAYQYTGLI